MVCGVIFGNHDNKPFFEIIQMEINPKVGELLEWVELLDHLRF